MEPSLSNYSAAALAYLGDCALEICAREYLVSKMSNVSSARLNKAAMEFVCAPKQAAAVKNLLDLLSEDESAAFHLGRNMGHTSIPRSATASEYRNATGLEAIFGWLHILGKQERMRELFRIAYGLNVEE